MAPIAWRSYTVPAEEQRRGFRVLHPRWTPIPAVGMRISPWLLCAASARTLTRLLDQGSRFDAIDAHYFYPDGVAAVWLGRRFGLPVVITARGSDVTQFPNFALPRRLILQAAWNADAIITVSAGLRDALDALGVPPAKITVLRNGVDLRMFEPRDRAQSRQAIGVTGKVLVSVGSLIERKGHHRTIEALAHLPGWQLLIAGDGPERARLERMASDLGVGARVRFLGQVPHAELAKLYSAADLSVLASSREGWANVLLESMACGTPAIASPIPGNPEVVQSPDAGLIASENSPAGLAAAIRAWEAAPSDRAHTRRYAEGFDWEATSAGQISLFDRVISAKTKQQAP